MGPRLLTFAAAALLCLSGCGSEAPQNTQNEEVDPAAFAGIYRVSGRTVEKQSGQGREIEGTIIFDVDDAGYTASFELTTLFPTEGGPVEAQIVGTGAGEVVGAELHGTAETQIILAQVPGVDANFAFLPRTYGPRIRSASVTRLNADGSLTIDIETEGAEGETGYRGTRTSVTGHRDENARTAP